MEGVLEMTKKKYPLLTEEQYKTLEKKSKNILVDMGNDALAYSNCQKCGVVFRWDLPATARLSDFSIAYKPICNECSKRTEEAARIRLIPFAFDGDSGSQDYTE